MKTLINKTLWLASLVLVSASASLVISCDDDKNGPGVQLLSFGPSLVEHGDDIQFIGTGLDKVTSIVLPPNIEIPKSEFKSQSARLIVITVPIETTTGKVILKTPGGDIESKSVFGLDYEFSINSVTEQAKPGTNITITGEFLNYVKEVWFAQDQIATEFVSQSRTELVVMVPFGAQTGTIAIADGGDKILESENQLTVTVPAISDVSPLSLRHTEELTITGTDLDLITSIDFAGPATATTFVSKTENQIVVAVPVGATTGKLTLKQASPITVVSDESVAVILPAASSVSPSPATPGTSTITITGTNLDLVASLKLNGVTDPIASTAFTTHTATQITFGLPATATGGGITYNTIHGYQKALGVSIVVPGAPPSPLAIGVYDETFAFNGQDWGWSASSSSSASTEEAYSGTKGWKFVASGGDAGLQIGNLSGLNVSSATHLVFSVYGGPGTEGKQLGAILNDAWGNYNSVIIKEGAWKEFKIPLADYPDVDKTNIAKIAFKLEASDWTIFMDRIGFE